MNLKELSALLGLSQTTVSRALNGYPEVSEATRKRVAQAAKDHNYHPNMRAKQLATGRTMSIGHVIPISTRHEIVNPVFADFISGAGEVYAEHGYDLLLSVVPDTDEEKTYRDLAERGAVDGVVVHGPRPDDPRIRLLTEIGLPFVVHGRCGGDSTAYSWVDVDNFAAMRLATDHLIGLGHRRIRLINGNEALDFAIQRRLGYNSALAAAGLAPDPAPLFSEEMTEEAGYRLARRCLEGPSPPTAFVASSIITTLGIRRATHEAALRIGTDISVVTYDDDLSYLRNGDEAPIYSAVRSSVREAGTQLARILLERIKAPDAPPRHVLLTADLIEGGSSGPCPPPDTLP